MSTQNNNWIDKVKKELNEYTPAYNDSDWKALESKLPASKGWMGLPKQFINWLKVIVFASVTVTVIVLLIQPKTESTNSEKASQTENTKPAEQFSVSTDAQRTNLIKEKKAEEIIKSDSVATPPANLVSSQNSSPKKVLNNNQSSGQKPEPIETALISEPVKDNSIDNSKVVEKPGLPAGIDSSTINLPDSSVIISPQITQNQVTENQQVSANGNYEKPKQDNQQIKNQQEQPGNIKKESKKLFKKPLLYIPKTSFLIGATYAVSFETGMAPYQSKINALNGGLVLEKFLSEKSSVAFKPQIHIKNFYDNEIIQINDTVSNSTTVDSLGIPVEKPEITVSEKEITHTLEWIYIDFPLIYSRYFVRRDNYRLAISAGISNKYFLSLKNDGNSVSLDQSFYLAQSGLISFKYQKAWNKKLFLDVEPFASVPFRKISAENYQWTSFGVNVSLLFDVSKK
jgi:hypothetical protein